MQSQPKQDTRFAIRLQIGAVSESGICVSLSGPLHREGPELCHFEPALNFPQRASGEKNPRVSLRVRTRLLLLHDCRVHSQIFHPSYLVAESQNLACDKSGCVFFKNPYRFSVNRVFGYISIPAQSLRSQCYPSAIPFFSITSFRAFLSDASDNPRGFAWFHFKPRCG